MEKATFRGPARAALAALAVLAVLGGCGGSGLPDLAFVTGVVTWDSKPLVGAIVEFQPETGKASRGVTDQEGRYELVYLRDVRGAVLGRHRVRIITDHEGAGDQTRRIALPAKYGHATELTADVGPGENRIDFPLRSE